MHRSDRPDPSTAALLAGRAVRSQDAARLRALREVRSRRTQSPPEAGSARPIR